MSSYDVAFALSGRSPYLLLSLIGSKHHLLFGPGTYEATNNSSD